MSATPLESAKACWERIQLGSPIYRFLLEKVELASAEHGTIIAKLPVTENLLNSKKGLHGSTTATIVDWAGGIAIATTGMEKTGVSTDIHVSYVSSAKVGDTLTIQGKVSKLGRNLAFTTVTIYKGEGDDQQVVAHGTHTKYVLRDQPPKPSS